MHLLDASMHLYNSVCSSVCPYVRLSVRMSVCPIWTHLIARPGLSLLTPQVVNASTIVFDNKCSYPNFYYNFFNKTIDLFAPSCFRDDNDYEVRRDICPLCRGYCTLAQNHVVLRHPIIHFPMSEGVSERASKRVSSASDRANR